jgi:hypothetical protein
MPHMKLVGKLGLLLGIILSILVGLNTLNYLWLVPIMTFQTLSYYLFHFKNFKFKKIDKRNNPFIKELPHHLIFQSFIVFICFGAGLSLNTFYEHDAYVSLLGQITKFFDAINFLIDAVKQAMIEFYNAILQSRFN